MPYIDFSEIDNLHSEWSRMEKAARLSWLSGEKARLTGLANQFSLYIYAKGGLMNGDMNLSPVTRGLTLFTFRNVEMCQRFS